MRRAMEHGKRVAIGVIGGIVLLIGIIAIPYPGPGWLIVFTGLAILATEFAWARGVLDYAKEKYDAWEKWLKRQHFGVRLSVLALTGLVVVLTLWLLNVYGLMAELLQVDIPWLSSPLGFFSK